jgi:type IV fimbrial biogenesis protein FimT
MWTSTTHGRFARRVLKDAGVTLVELIAVITIAAILMSIGVPSYRYVTNSNRVAAESNALLADMQLARSEAVKEGQPVSVCPATRSGATWSCTGSNHWEVGWIVFTDPAGSGNYDAANDTVLHTQAAFATATDSFTSDSGLNFVTFNREGFATGFPPTANGYATITLHTTPNQSQWTRCLQIFATGLMSIEKTSDPQGNCT